MDPLAVEEYFALGYIAEPRTIFQPGEEAAEPAHSLLDHRGQLASGRLPAAASRTYWDVRFTGGQDPTSRGRRLRRTGGRG